MNRRLFSHLSLLIILIAACQPIRPEGAATPSPSATRTEAITGTTEITSTTVITSGSSITESSEITNSEEITEAAESTSTQGTEDTTSTPSTLPATPSNPPATAADASTNCPVIADEALDIAILAGWEEDEQRHYLVHKSNSQSVDGEEVVAASSTTPLTITVVSDDGEGYVLEWQYGRTVLNDTGFEVPDPLAGLFQSPLELLVTYSTDEAGVYVELQNEEQLQAQLTPLFDQIFDAMLASDEELDPEVVENARGMVDELISDPANFESLFTQEIQLFHTLFAFTFESSEPLVTPDLRPNLLGGPPIPSELTITPTHYDADLGCLSVALENVADPVEARNSILQSLQEQAEQMGVPGPTDADLPEELELVDNVRFEFDLESGWPTAIYSERAISIGNQDRLETTDIVLVGENEG